MARRASASPSDTAAGALRPSDLLRLGAGLGALAALVHIAVATIAHEWFGELTFSGRVLPWMAPPGYLFQMLLLAVPAAAAVAMWPHPRVARAGAFMLTGVAAFAMLLHVTVVHPAALALLAAGIGARASGALVDRRTLWPGRALRWATPLALGSLLLAGAVFAGRRLVEARAVAEGAPPSLEAPNILLLVLDTVRAASLSLYGYDRPTTPHLEAFARQAVTFDWAMAPSPWTLPTHASLFTGRWPQELSSGWRSPLDDSEPTIAEILRDAGYATAGFTANIWYTAPESGLARGFEYYRAYRWSWKQVLWSTTLTQVPVLRDALRDRRLPADLLGASRWRWIPSSQAFDRKWAPDVTDEFLAWHATAGEQPFFAFLNYFDAHDPYWPPGPWRTRFADEPGPQDGYDGAIALIDAELARLFRVLDARGTLERTIVVVTADHGEQFGEHGLMSHGNSLYLPLLHVPLVIRPSGPAVQGHRVATPVSLRDLGTTLLALAGVSPHALPGRSFAGLVRRPSSEPGTVHPLLAHVEGSPGGGRTDMQEPTAAGEMHAVVLAPWHYLRAGNGTEEVYDFLRDRAEEHNLIDSLAGSPLLRTLREHARSIP